MSSHDRSPFIRRVIDRDDFVGTKQLKIFFRVTFRFGQEFAGGPTRQAKIEQTLELRRRREKILPAEHRGMAKGNASRVCCEKEFRAVAIESHKSTT